MKFDIIGKRYWAFLISGILILVSIIFLATAGLKPGIEFSSGSILTVSFPSDVNYEDFNPYQGTHGRAEGRTGERTPGAVRDADGGILQQYIPAGRRRNDQQRHHRGTDSFGGYPAVHHLGFPPDAEAVPLRRLRGDRADS